MSNVIVVNFTKVMLDRETNLMARQRGMVAAWTGNSNPYSAGSTHWLAFNLGRKQVSRSAPLMPDDYEWFNPVLFTGRKKVK